MFGKYNPSVFYLALGQLLVCLTPIFFYMESSLAMLIPGVGILLLVCAPFYINRKPISQADQPLMVTNIVLSLITALIVFMVGYFALAFAAGFSAGVNNEYAGLADYVLPVVMYLVFLALLIVPQIIHWKRRAT